MGEKYAGGGGGQACCVQLLCLLLQVNYLQQCEPGIVMFKLDCGLQFRVSMNPANMQSLRLKVASLQTTGLQYVHG